MTAQHAVAGHNETTTAMRAALAARGIAPLDDEELDTLSRQLVSWLEQKRRDDGDEHSTGWFQLWQMLDDDGSNDITFDELTKAVRIKLRRDASAISDERLMSLWCALDVDDSNQVRRDEMGGFLRRGWVPPGRSEGPSRQDEMQAFEASLKGKAKAGDTVNTKQMRAQLASAGEGAPDEEELRALSRLFNERMRRAYPDSRHTTWITLFKAIDRDASGFVSFDELRHIARITLAIPPSELLEPRLRALWCLLDAEYVETESSPIRISSHALSSPYERETFPPHTRATPAYSLPAYCLLLRAHSPLSIATADLPCHPPSPRMRTQLVECNPDG